MYLKIFKLWLLPGNKEVIHFKICFFLRAGLSCRSILDFATFSFLLYFISAKFSLLSQNNAFCPQNNVEEFLTSQLVGLLRRGGNFY